MWIRAYLSRYGKDLSAFAKVYVLCSITVLPTALFGFGVYFVFVYLYMWMFGLLNMAIFATLTAVWSRFVWKSLVFVIALAANGYVMWPILSYDPSPLAPGAVNMTALLYYQVMFLFGLFYLLMDRPWERFSIGDFEKHEEARE